jgi:RHS repeat-associated protein
MSISIEYDPMNRERTRTVPDNPDVAGNYGRVLVSTYDLTGKPLSASMSGDSVVYAYDSAGRIDTVTDTYGGNSYLIDPSFDEAGNRKGTTWPGGGSITYTYDALNRMDLVTSNIPGLTPTVLQLADYDYDSRSAIERTTFGNGTVSDPDYYPDGALRTVVNSIPGRSLAMEFERNDLDEITALITTVSNPSAQWTDAIFAWRPDSPSSVAYLPNKLNRYSQVAGATLQYDANGNLTSDGVWNFTYDEENRLRTASGTQKPSVSYEYDPLGRRRAKTVDGVKTIYLSDGVEEVEERRGDNNAVLRRYAYGASIDDRIAMIDPALCAGGGRCFYLTDHHDSTVAFTNQDGSINQTYGYDPFGNPATSVAGMPTTGNPFRYTGRRLDPETNLYYFRARYYSPELGRFLQTDPIGTKDDLNLYAYVHGDPLNHSDPTGEITVEDAGQARDWFQTNTDGHHYVPFGSTVKGSDGAKLDISREAREVWGANTTGEKLPDHKFDGPHREYNKAVTAELESYAKTNKIDLSKMTKTQAMDFLTHIKNSNVPAIKNFLGPIEEFTAKLRAYAGTGVGSSIRKAGFRMFNAIGFVQTAENTQSPNTESCKMQEECRVHVRGQDYQTDNPGTY